MAEITLNGLRVTSLSLALPRVGAWTADVAVDTDTELTGAVTLVVDGATWAGSVVRGAVYAGSWRGRIVGAPGLLATVAPTALQGATLAVVLAGVLGAVGERLAGSAGALDAAAPLWHQHAVRAAHVVGDVARAAGYAWRVLADGTVWMGTEAWATSTPAGAVDVIDEAPETGRLLLAGDTLGILPGQTLALPRRVPARVGYVEHRGTADELRTVVLLERDGDPAASPAGRLLAALEAIVQRAMRRVDFHALYPSRVVSQGATGLLDLVPDDDRVPSCSGVPIRHGLPGVTVQVTAGERVLLGYEAGDPSKPYASLWSVNDGSAVTITLSGGTAKAAREGDAVSVTVPPDAFGSGIPSAPVTLSGTITAGSDALRLP